MSEFAGTSDPSVLTRVGKKPKQNYQGKEYCKVCGEEKHFTGRYYLHDCKARMKSGKSLKRR